MAACDGEDALRVSEQENGPIELMVTDMAMPKMGGRELAERIGPARPSMRVLFVSGYSEEMVADADRLDGHFHFLQKPFEIEELARAVRQTLDAPAK